MRSAPLLSLLWLFSPTTSHTQDPPQPQPLARLGSTVRTPIPIAAPAPKWPDKAKAYRQSGICVISIIVDALGMPQDPHVIRCTDPMFEASSIDTVQKYRFKPAVRIADGQPFPVKIAIEIHFSYGNQTPWTEPPTRVRYSLSSPPGVTSRGPDSDGIYPLSEQMEAPRMVEFVSNGFGEAAMGLPDGVGCHVLVTLNAKGKSVDVQVMDCDQDALKQPAGDSLLKSRFKPAKLNGKAIPVRMMVQLVYLGFAEHQIPDVSNLNPKP